MTKFNSLKTLQQNLFTHQTNCVTITKDYLKTIETKKHLNAFVEVFEKESLLRAESIDKKIKAGKAGKLAGLVIAIKDNICYEGHKVTAASKILENFTSVYSSTVVERLLAEDAIIIGRLNCDEFAMGSSNENTIYGRVKHPMDQNKVAGGSSGGSAAAVAAGLCLASLGSDTGGSIRQPAAFCGVVGLKPTYSRVSRHGLISYASSFDQIGPITKNIDDAALILEVISGKDDYDSTCSSVEKFSFVEKPLDINQKKIAYFEEYLNLTGLDPEIKIKTEKIIDKLRKDGHIVEPISFPYLDVLVPIYYIITTAEASSNLARYDGVHYGYRSDKASDLETTYLKSRTEGFGEEVKRRIMLGTFVLSSGYQDAYFTKAQQVRRLIYNYTKDKFKKYDFIISPTTPHTTFDAGIEHQDPTKMYNEDIFTVHANLSGNPAISIPVAEHSNGFPIGLQILANHFKEEELLLFSKYFFC